MTNQQALDLLTKIQLKRSRAAAAYAKTYAWETNAALEAATAREAYFLSFLDRKLRFTFAPYNRQTP